MAEQPKMMTGFKLLKPSKLKEGQCPDCLTIHPPEQPHNRDSLPYQYEFYSKQGRWPTWADAMSHCSDELKALWKQALIDKGVKWEEPGVSETVPHPDGLIGSVTVVKTEKDHKPHH